MRVSPCEGGGDLPPPPLPQKLACPPPPNCFDPKMPILSFSSSFWQFCPNCPLPPIDPIWETLPMRSYKLVL